MAISVELTGMDANTRELIARQAGALSMVEGLSATAACIPVMAIIGRKEAGGLSLTLPERNGNQMHTARSFSTPQG